MMTSDDGEILLAETQQRLQQGAQLSVKDRAMVDAIRYLIETKAATSTQAAEILRTPSRNAIMSFCNRAHPKIVFARAQGGNMRTNTVKAPAQPVNQTLSTRDARLDLAVNGDGGFKASGGAIGSMLKRARLTAKFGHPCNWHGCHDQALTGKPYCKPHLSQSGNAVVARPYIGARSQ